MENDPFRIWESTRDELRKLRGSNLFRGRETHFQEKGIIVLEREFRGEGKKQGEVQIHLFHPEGIEAVVLPENEKIKLNDFGGEMQTFLLFILKKCRGEEYLHTNSKTADYRRKTEILE